MEYPGKLSHRLDMSGFHFYLHIYGKGRWKTHDTMIGSWHMMSRARWGIKCHTWGKNRSRMAPRLWCTTLPIGGRPHPGAKCLGKSSHGVRISLLIKDSLGGELPLPVLPLSVLSRWTTVLCAWWQVISLSKQHFTKKNLYLILCVQ